MKRRTPEATSEESGFDPWCKFKTTQTPLAVLSDPEISPGAKLLYGVLVYHWGAPKQNRVCNPKLTTLGSAMAVSIDSIGRWMDELAKAGYIERHRGGPGQTARCVFLFHPRFSDSAGLRNQDFAVLRNQESALSGCKIPQNRGSDSAEPRNANKEEEKFLREVSNTSSPEAAAAHASAESASPSHTSPQRKRPGRTDTLQPAVVEAEISQAADRIYQRHPSMRRCAVATITNRLRTIVNNCPSHEKIPKLRQIDANHAGMCATEEWSKDGGRFAKGLENWLAPSKHCFDEPPPAPSGTAVAVLAQASSTTAASDDWPQGLTPAEYDEKYGEGWYENFGQHFGLEGPDRVIDNLPENADAERVVLGAMLSNAQVIDPVRSVLSADDFTAESRRRTFHAIGDMWAAGESPVPGALAKWCHQRGTLDSIGGMSGLMEIEHEWCASMDLDRWVQRVKDASLRRRVIHHAHAIAGKCSDWTIEFDAIAAEWERAAKTVYDDYTPRAAMSGEEIIHATGGISAFLAPRGGLLTPWPTFNRATGGLAPGDLVVIAARPSDGKTTLMMNTVLHAAYRGTRSLVFSLEMTGASLMIREIASRADVTFQQIRVGRLTPDERRRVSEAAAFVAKLPILYERKLGYTVMGIRGEVRKASSEGPLGLICVDYLQRMTSPTPYREKRLGIAEITGGLKDIAMEFNVPLVVLLQLTRAAEKEGRKPDMHDLIESGYIEADADLIALIYRPDKKAEAPCATGRAQLLIRKQRNGETRDIELIFDKRRGRFFEVDAAQASEPTDACNVVTLPMYQNLQAS